MKTKNSLLLLLVIFTLASCNDSDDVIAIFTGKTWKLNAIYHSGREDRSYWIDKDGNPNAEAFEESLKKKKETGTFTVRFDGAQEGDLIIGTFSGVGYNATFTGEWSCNADNRQINIRSFTPNGSDSDVLAKAFVNAMQNVISYRSNSDINNLHLDFKEKELTKYMSFTVSHEK